MEKLIKNAVDAVEALIRAELQSGKLGRFVRIQKLCVQAVAFERMAALATSRVDQNAETTEPVGGVFGEVAEDAVQLGRLGRRGGGAFGPDSIDLIREVVSTIQPLIQDTVDRAARARARALVDDLLRMREAAEAIGDSTENIDTQLREQLATGVRDAVVSAELLRGRQVGTPGRLDAGDRGESDAGGEAGAGESKPDGDQKGLGDRPRLAAG